MMWARKVSGAPPSMTVVQRTRMMRWTLVHASSSIRIREGQLGAARVEVVE